MEFLTPVFTFVFAIVAYASKSFARVTFTFIVF
jgi:hypothetical protein